ncbi:MAG: hypothetical protein K9J37_23565 [Saprospiraceae bacterium]|nr:hypothetical protein [Saprospiraceae bacterium]MCF8252905.1 hypothetical protein [Saprospiraceae bacterium]MCF8314447.1 hypothetical protein [Saprospiraceae bacterium]MCF8443331.1 hypothetical protein [Saprospiraceae bacterium]
MDKIRRRQLELVRRGWLRHLKRVNRKDKQRSPWIKAPPPIYSRNLSWIMQNPDSFVNGSIKTEKFLPTITLEVPTIFSLIEEEEKSFQFLKELFHHIQNQTCGTLYLDYTKCEKIDVDASVCMDIIIQDFKSYFANLLSKGYEVRLLSIKPLNFQKEQISKILFSIGAFRNLLGLERKYPDIITYPLCCGRGIKVHSDQKLEVDVTALVDYILKCTSKMKRPLNFEAERNLFQVIGEVMANCQGHSTTQCRYSIGYFQEEESQDGHIGTFHLVIMNFGESIYQKFKNPRCENPQVVERMVELSSNYTRKSFLQKGKFEEDTLWTLYSLQEGVTSSSKKRGSGTITFIEHFFYLKGNRKFDNVSRLNICSGNARIVFDGTYGIIEKPSVSKETKYKMITFNESNDIQDPPDNNYVKYSKNYFPGTIISAKILIKDDNLQPN